MLKTIRRAVCISWLLALFCPSLSYGSGWPFRTDICLSLLQNWGDIEQVTAVRSNVREAASLFRDFRMNVLGIDRNLRPTGKRVRAHSNRRTGWGSAVRAVADRIRGIEMDVWDHEQRESLDKDFIVQGLVISGAKDIDFVLEAMNRIENYPSITGRLAFGYLHNTFLTSIALRSQTETLAGKAFVFFMMATALEALVRGVPERADLSFHSHTHQIRAFLKSEASDEWFYDGDTFQIDRSHIKQALEGESQRVYGKTARFSSSPANATAIENITRLALGVRFFPFIFQPDDPVSVSWDRLVYRDFAKEPVLVLMVRYHRDPPTYPRRVENPAFLPWWRKKAMAPNLIQIPTSPAERKGH